MKTNIILSMDILRKCDLNENVCQNQKIKIEKLHRENEKLLKMIELDENIVKLNEPKKMAERGNDSANESLDESKRSDSGILSDLLKSFKKSSGSSADESDNSNNESSTLNIDYKSLIAAMSSVNIDKSIGKTNKNDAVIKKVDNNKDEIILKNNNAASVAHSEAKEKIKSRALIGNITDIKNVQGNTERDKKYSSVHKDSVKLSTSSVEKSKKSVKNDKNNSYSVIEVVKDKSGRIKNGNDVEVKSKISYKSYGDYGKSLSDKRSGYLSSKVVEEKQNKYSSRTTDVTPSVESLSDKLSNIDFAEKKHSTRRHHSNKYADEIKYTSTEGEGDKVKSKEDRKHLKSGELIDKKVKSDRSRNSDKVIFLERGPVRCKTNDIRSNMPPYERQQIHRNSLSGGKVLMAVSPVDYEKPLIPKTVNKSATDNLDLRFMVQPSTNKERLKKSSKKNVPHELAVIVDQLRRESAKFSSAQRDSFDSDLWKDAKVSPEDFCNWEEDLNMIMEILEGDNRLKSKRNNIQNCHVPVMDTNVNAVKENNDMCFEKIDNRDTDLQSLYPLDSNILNNNKNGPLFTNYCKDDIHRNYSTEESSNCTSVSSPETENMMYLNKNYGSQSVPLTIQLSSPVSSECDSRKHTPDSGVSNGSLGSASLSPFSYQTNGHSPMHGFRSPSLDRSDNSGSENHLYEYSYKPHSVSRESYSSASPMQSPNVSFQEDDLEFVNEALTSYISEAQSDTSSVSNDTVFKDNSLFSQQLGDSNDLILQNSPNLDLQSFSIGSNQLSMIQNTDINYGSNNLLLSGLHAPAVQNSGELQSNEYPRVIGQTGANGSALAASQLQTSLTVNQKYNTAFSLNTKESLGFIFPETVASVERITPQNISSPTNKTELQTDRTFKLIKRKLIPIASKETFPCCVSYKKSAKDVLEEMFDRLDDNLKKLICFQVHGIDEYKLMDLFDGQLSSWNESVGSQLPRLPFLYATCERLLMSTATINKFFEVYMNGHTVLDRAILTCSQTPLVARYLAECALRALPRLPASKDNSLDKSDSNGSGVLHRCVLMGASCSVALAGLLSINSQEQVFGVNRLNADGYSPLHIACSHHSTPIAGGQCCCQLTVHVLLVHGQADPNTKDGKSGNTALHAAVDSGACAPALVTLLLQHGAKPLLRNYSGATPLDHARTASRSANRPQFPKQVMDILKKYK